MRIQSQTHSTKPKIITYYTLRLEVTLCLYSTERVFKNIRMFIYFFHSHGSPDRPSTDPLRVIDPREPPFLNHWRSLGRTSRRVVYVGITYYSSLCARAYNNSLPSTVNPRGRMYPLPAHTWPSSACYINRHRRVLLC